MIIKWLETGEIRSYTHLYMCHRVLGFDVRDIIIDASQHVAETEKRLANKLDAIYNQNTEN